MGVEVGGWITERVGRQAWPTTVHSMPCSPAKQPIHSAYKLPRTCATKPRSQGLIGCEFKCGKGNAVVLRYKPAAEVVGDNKRGGPAAPAPGFLNALD
jgi:hypothetical protein